VYPLDDFGKRNFVLHQILYIEKRIFMTNNFRMLFQRFLVDGDAFQNQSSFFESKGIALYDIRVVGIFIQEFVM